MGKQVYPQIPLLSSEEHLHFLFLHFPGFDITRFLFRFVTDAVKKGFKCIFLSGNLTALDRNHIQPEFAVPHGQVELLDMEQFLFAGGEIIDVEYALEAMEEMKARATAQGFKKIRLIFDVGEATRFREHKAFMLLLEELMKKRIVDERFEKISAYNFWTILQSEFAHLAGFHAQIGRALSRRELEIMDMLNPLHKLISRKAITREFEAFSLDYLPIEEGNILFWRFTDSSAATRVPWNFSDMLFYFISREMSKATGKRSRIAGELGDTRKLQEEYRMLRKETDSLRNSYDRLLIDHTKISREYDSLKISATVKEQYPARKNG